MLKNILIGCIQFRVNSSKFRFSLSIKQLCFIDSVSRPIWPGRVNGIKLFRIKIFNFPGQIGQETLLIEQNDIKLFKIKDF